MLLPTSDDWRLRPEFAHTRARDLFLESWWWDSLDDLSPWGSDEGADALIALAAAHSARGEPPESVAAFVQDYVSAGGGWDASEPLEREIADHDLLMYARRLLEVAAIVLGMYLFHGYVPRDAKELGLAALERLAHPDLLRQLGWMEERLERLTLMRERLKAVETDP